ncbi:hypothetical protein HW555_012763 [Spodoptera exigua]|uniref:Uncharacterized protein n=1 Tax=Spodoptera exigua TaxID=7107 RepID=A0A835G4B4_SPOEX|nr:hypothetical protein HW555_012763 [Spodoptera exigua]
MAFTLNLSRFTNLFRSRWALMTEVGGVYRPHISTNKEKLISLIREKADAATKSELAKKMKVLKGFYTVELSPPRGSEFVSSYLKDKKTSEPRHQRTVSVPSLQFSCLAVSKLQ